MKTWNTRGNIKILGDRRFRLDITVNGRRHIRIFRTRKHAARAQANFRDQQKPKHTAPTVADVWQHYLAHLRRTGKPSSVKTCEYVRKHWATLEDEQPEHLTQQKIDDLLDEWTVKTRTKNVRKKYLRAALRRAFRDKKIAALPSLDLGEHKAVVPIASILTGPAVRQLFDGAATAQTKAIIALALYAGLRRGEIVTLTVEDAHPEYGEILVRAKGDFSPKDWEDRRIDMHPDLPRYLKDHLAMLPSPPPPNPEEPEPINWLFPRASDPAQHITLARANIEVREAFENADLYDPDRRTGLHMLRRTWATNFLKHGDIGTLMRLGGWNQLKTVEAYLGLNDEAARAAIHAIEY